MWWCSYATTIRRIDAYYCKNINSILNEKVKKMNIFTKIDLHDTYNVRKKMNTYYFGLINNESKIIHTFHLIQNINQCHFPYPKDCMLFALYYTLL